MEEGDLLDESDDEFTVTEMQDSPATFSKKIIKTLHGYIYATPLWVLMSSTLKQYNQ